ncbi:MAG: SLBB domain-containing protein [Pseudomonadales bacterium]
MFTFNVNKNRWFITLSLICCFLLQTTYVQAEDLTDIDFKTDVDSTAEDSFTSNEVAMEPSQNVAPTPLEPFGYSLFEQAPNTFAPINNIPIPNEYIVGPGDEINILLFGTENFELTLTVSREGVVNFPRIGPIAVSGLTFKELKELLNSRISEQIIGVKANITLGALRSIRVFVLGDVNQPGTYTVSSLSTLTNALFACGGIKPIGTLRDIELKRNRQVAVRFDLYDLLLRGDTSKDIRLLPGDVIFVKPVGKTVGIDGEVRRPAIYELGPQENDLSTLLNYAGGMLPTAYPKISQIERIGDNGLRTLIGVDLSTKSSLLKSVNDGDIVRVFSVLESMPDLIKITGHIYRPINTRWQPGLRVQDVLKSMQALKPGADANYVLIRREKAPGGDISVLQVDLEEALNNPFGPANIQLAARDHLMVFAKDEGRSTIIGNLINELKLQAEFGQPAQLVTIAGNVRLPGEYPYQPDMRISDLVSAALNLQPATDMQYGLIKRLNQAQNTFEVLSFALKDLLYEKHNTADLKLKPGDEVAIFAITEERQSLITSIVASLKEQANFDQPEPVVVIEGNVKYPGNYPLAINMRVSDLVRAALDVLPETDRQYALLQRFSTNDMTNVFPVALDDILLDENHASNIKLQPRDKLFVFTKHSDRRIAINELVDNLNRQARLGQPALIVKVNGKVEEQGAYPLTQGMRVSDLILAAGGLAEAAYTMTAEITRYVIGQNSELEASHQTINLGLAMAGDVSENLLLEPHDTITIKQTPDWHNDRYITISGEVKFPGTYPITKGETLSQVLARAGGQSKLGDINGAIFSRQSLRENEEAQKLQLIKEMEEDIVNLEATFNYPVDAEEPYDSKDSQELLSMKWVLSQVKKTSSIGRLVIDLPGILAKSEADIILKHGDMLHIPQHMQEIAVMGEVMNPSSVLYATNTTFDDYIQASGGLTSKADQSRIYVVKANGSVVTAKTPTKQLFGQTKPSGQLVIEAGDIIMVPMDLEHVSDLAWWTDISQITYRFALAAESLNSLGIF